MSAYVDPSSAEKPYRDPTPLPDNIPKVHELGTSSAPLKSAAFFLGAYCKDYNGACQIGASSLCAYESPRIDVPGAFTAHTLVTPHVMPC